jgi:hypothetical protein
MRTKSAIGEIRIVLNISRVLTKHRKRDTHISHLNVTHIPPPSLDLVRVERASEPYPSNPGM